MTETHPATLRRAQVLAYLRANGNTRLSAGQICEALGPGTTFYYSVVYADLRAFNRNGLIMTSPQMGSSIGNNDRLWWAPVELPAALDRQAVEEWLAS